MKRLIILFLVLLTLLSGCSQKNKVLIYEGESVNWKVTYRIVYLNKDQHDAFYHFVYKGTNVEKAGKVEFNIDGPRDGEGGEFTLTKEGNYSGKIWNTGDLPSIRDRGINVEFEWDGHTEIMTLTKN